MAKLNNYNGAFISVCARVSYVANEKQYRYLLLLLISKLMALLWSGNN